MSRRINSGFAEDLARQEFAGLLRVDREISKPDARRIRPSAGQACIDFSSNGYLGLHEKISARAARRFLKGRHLSSTASSRMVSGTHPLHRSLETALARFTGAADAAVFGSGYLCCAGVVSTLAGGRDGIFFDEKIHASLRVGINLSAAESTAYRHADVADLRKKLSAGAVRGRTFIVTDGLFSMNGDFAPLDRLIALADRAGAWLIVDDAHGLGAVGRRGRGTFERFGRTPGPRHILIGTLSKTFASYGGFVAAESSVIRYLKARAKEFIYTTSAPPFQLIAAQEALSVVRSAAGSALREKLRRNTALLGRLLGRPLASHIVSIPVRGGPAAVLDAARRLRDRGCYAVGMRYPTVPRGQEMIRVSLSAVHTPADIRRLAGALHAVLDR